MFPKVRVTIYVSPTFRALMNVFVVFKPDNKQHILYLAILTRRVLIVDSWYIHLSTLGNFLLNSQLFYAFT